MHALRHVHGLLAPDGILVDLHPIAEYAVHAEGRELGLLEEPKFRTVDLPNAEARLREAVEAGLYALEAETEFVFLQYFDDPDEVLETVEDPAAVDPELIRRLRDAAPPLVTSGPVVLRRLRAQRGSPT